MPNGKLRMYELPPRNEAAPSKEGHSPDLEPPEEPWCSSKTITAFLNWFEHGKKHIDEIIIQLYFQLNQVFL